MAIAGNYQIRPDAYRERGYSLSAEYTAADRLALGVSSLATHAARDLYQKVPNTRQAHGLFARFAPWQPLVTGLMILLAVWIDMKVRARSEAG